jgi:hypothetical protein
VPRLLGATEDLRVHCHDVHWERGHRLQLSLLLERGTRAAHPRVPGRGCPNSYVSVLRMSSLSSNPALSCTHTRLVDESTLLGVLL